MNIESVKIISQNPHILHISLNRPNSLNALNQDMLNEISRQVMLAKNNPLIKAVLISGEGKAFCAGADIKQLQSLKNSTALLFAKNGQRVFSELEEMGKPVLAAIHGVAFGGGCELAMACTLRIATQNSSFAQPEIKLGVIPGFGGTQRLAKLIGMGRALEICLTGKKISASDALSWGLLNEICAEEELLPRAYILLESIIQNSPTAIHSILRSIQIGYDLSIAEGLELEATHFALCCNTEDKQEGVSAFLEKRAATFKGI